MRYSLKNKRMTIEEQQKYFGLATRHYRLARLYAKSQIGASKTFDRLCWAGFILGGVATVYSGRTDLWMMILVCAIFVIAVHLATALFRRVLSHHMRPLYDEIHVGYRLAHDEGWQAGMDGSPVETCPYAKEKVEQAGFAKQWMDGHRRALARLGESSV